MEKLQFSLSLVQNIEFFFNENVITEAIDAHQKWPSNSTSHNEVG